MLKQGQLTDDNLTIFKATTIFEFVNMQSGEEEGGDEDEVSCRTLLELPDTTLASGRSSSR